MRPATPNFNFAQQAGPSSPPQTPTTSTSTYVFNKTQNRRHGQHFTQLPQLPPQGLNGNGNIIPNGQGPNSFCYVPSHRPADLSPRSSSPDSSVATSDSGSPPRSLASSPAEPMSSSPPLRKKPIIAQGKCNFTVEEFGESDYEDFDSDDSVIRAHEYEEPDSDRPPSVKAPRHSDLDAKIYRGFQNLNTAEEDDIMGPELDREAWLEKVRAERRRKRRSSGSVKRVFSQSIGSDTDDEDIQPVTFEGANSARRLRRKTATGDRASLIFDDPPPRIDELEEPESCEELVDIRESDDEARGGLRELPYYVQDMDVDSSDDDEEEEEDDKDEDEDEEEI